jgi:hypothetical protein
MVRAAIAHLAVKLVRGGMRLDEVVSRPFELVERIGELAGGYIGGAVIDDAPREHGRRCGHRQPELHVITGVVPAAGEIAPDIRAIRHAGVAAPVHAVAGGQVTGALRFVEEQRLLQCLAVVEGLAE